MHLDVYKRQGQASMTPALDALMSLGDMRFAPYLSFLSKNLPPGRLAALLAETEAMPTDLGCGWPVSYTHLNENTAPAGCVPGLSGLRILVLSDIHTNLRCV